MLTARQLEILNNCPKVFKQHGFNPNTVSGGNQAVGNCIFCGGNKFFVNIENKMWDCKTCGRQGGYKTFIEELLNWGSSYLDVKRLKLLSKDRSLQLRTLRLAVKGFNPITNTYLVPTYNIKKTEVINVKGFSWKGSRKKRFITEGGKTGCLGWEDLECSEYKEFWIVEGEWDYLTMREILYKKKLFNHSVIGLSGASQFKDEMITMFRGRKVHVVLDFDPGRMVGNKFKLGAGTEGMQKIYNKLNSVARELSFIHWPDGVEKGHDLRDQYRSLKCNASQTYEFLLENMGHLPPEYTETEKKRDSKKPRKEEERKRGIKRIPHEEVYKSFQKYLHLPSTKVIDVVIGCIIGNRLPNDPIWLQLVGPSGSAKSVICQTLNCHYDIEAMDTFTSSTLVSGAQGDGDNDPSLLKRLDKRILVVKDLTTILELPAVVRDDIFGQLRSAFDGNYTKGFGVKGVRSRTYNSKFGFIAGVTPAIELYTDGHTSLGERFIRFNLESADIETILLKMESTIGNKENPINHLKEVVCDVIDFDYPVNDITVPEDMLNRLIKLCLFIEMMRGTVVRDKFSKEITHKAMVALPTRLFMQLRKELAGITAFKGLRSPDEEIFKTIVLCAKSTIPFSRASFFKKALKFIKGKGEVVIKELSEALKLPNITCQRQAETLTALGVLNKYNNKGLNVSYSLTSKVKTLIKESGIYGS